MAPARDGNAEPERGRVARLRAVSILVRMSQTAPRVCSCSRLARRPAEHAARADRAGRGRAHRPARALTANGPAHPGTAGRQPRLAACRRSGDAVARAAASPVGSGGVAGGPAWPRRNGVGDAAGPGVDRRARGAAEEPASRFRRSARSPLRWRRSNRPIPPPPCARWWRGSTTFPPWWPTSPWWRPAMPPRSSWSRRRPRASAPASRPRSRPRCPSPCPNPNTNPRPPRCRPCHRHCRAQPWPRIEVTPEVTARPWRPSSVAGDQRDRRHADRGVARRRDRSFASRWRGRTERPVRDVEHVDAGGAATGEDGAGVDPTAIRRRRGRRAAPPIESPPARRRAAAGAAGRSHTRRRPTPCSRRRSPRTVGGVLPRRARQRQRAEARRAGRQRRAARRDDRR